MNITEYAIQYRLKNNLTAETIEDAIEDGIVAGTAIGLGFAEWMVENVRQSHNIKNCYYYMGTLYTVDAIFQIYLNQLNNNG